jgi:hypothetical protein
MTRFFFDLCRVTLKQLRNKEQIDFSSKYHVFKFYVHYLTIYCWNHIIFNLPVYCEVETKVTQ